jgi:hypothetical protein
MKSSRLDQETLLDRSSIVLKSSLKNLGSVTLAKATPNFKHQFYLLGRVISFKLGMKPIVFDRSVDTPEYVGSVLQDYDIFNPRGVRFFILEGFCTKWIGKLTLQENTFILASSSNEGLPSAFFNKKGLRSFLKILWGITKINEGHITLKELQSLDLSSFTSYCEIEILTNILSVTQPSLRDIESKMDKVNRVNLLTLLKKAPVEEVIKTLRRVGHLSCMTMLINTVSDFVLYRLLLSSEGSHEVALQRLDISMYSPRSKEFMELTSLYSIQDLGLVIDRLVKFDKYIYTLHDVAIELFFLNITLRRR